MLRAHCTCREQQYTCPTLSKWRGAGRKCPCRYNHPGPQPDCLRRGATSAGLRGQRRSQPGPHTRSIKSVIEAGASVQQPPPGRPSCADWKPPCCCSTPAHLRLGNTGTTTDYFAKSQGRRQPLRLRRLAGAGQRPSGLRPESAVMQSLSLDQNTWPSVWLRRYPRGIRKKKVPSKAGASDVIYISAPGNRWPGRRGVGFRARCSSLGHRSGSRGPGWRGRRRGTRPPAAWITARRKCHRAGYRIVMAGPIDRSPNP